MITWVIVHKILSFIQEVYNGKKLDSEKEEDILQSLK